MTRLLELRDAMERSRTAWLDQAVPTDLDDPAFDAAMAEYRRCYAQYQRDTALLADWVAYLIDSGALVERVVPTQYGKLRVI